MNQHRPPTQSRTVSLFRNGRNQAIRIPVEFELPGDEATITRDGDRLVVEARPFRRKSLAEVLDALEPLKAEERFPDVDDDHLPMRDIDL